jgi:hypothetical protein
MMDGLDDAAEDRELLSDSIRSMRPSCRPSRKGTGGNGAAVRAHMPNAATALPCFIEASKLA